MTVPATTAVFTDVAAEFRAITEAAGLHDSSYTGRLKATGEDALDLLNRLSTNGIVNLAPGQGAPTILTTDRGRILDLLGVVNTGEYTLLITSPDCQQAVIDWLDKYTIMEDLEVEDISGETNLFTVCGPDSPAAVARAAGLEPGGASLEGLAPYSVLPAEIAGHSAVIIRRPLGAMTALDVVVDASTGAQVWETLAASGATPVGTEAFNAALVHNGIPRHGREMGDDFNPLEAGLIGSVDFAKGCYIGQEVIARLDTYHKVQKYLVRLGFSEGAQVAEDAVLELDGRNVGQVTSLSHLPSTGELVGLGYVRTASANPGQTLDLAAPSTGTARIIDLPQLFGPGE
ncbi:MAG: hypothetical protein OXI91_07905 [Chloroflexota bacterium]|nr:hypothetical protein [Chloroflexota bacterium]